MVAAFAYVPTLPYTKDSTRYRALGKEGVRLEKVGDRELLVVDAAALTRLAAEAFHDISFFLRDAHNEKVAKILDDPEASDNDIWVARAMLKNAVIAAEGKLPVCQDTGTATIVAKKGHRVLTDGHDEEALNRGIFDTFQKDNLRYSQTLPLNLYDEKNSGTNLPAQVDLYASEGDEYRFLFVAKGGGSANKSYLFQESKAVLNPASLEKFLVEKMKTLGTAACPPYHLAFVIGGTSAEATMKMVKLATAAELDDLPTVSNGSGQAFRDPELEKRLFEAAQHIGFGAQFGGKYYAHDVRVIRLPRHGASCPIGMGVSCSADRNARGKITRDGIFLEEMDRNPARWLTAAKSQPAASPAVKIDLD